MGVRGLLLVLGSGSHGYGHLGGARLGSWRMGGERWGGASAPSRGGG